MASGRGLSVVTEQDVGAAGHHRALSSPGEVQPSKTPVDLSGQDNYTGN